MPDDHHRSVLGSLGNGHRTGYAPWATEFLADHGAVSRILQRGQGTVLGHQVFGVQPMCLQSVADASKNTLLVGAPGQFRKMLGNSDARHVGAGFLEFTACGNDCDHRR